MLKPELPSRDQLAQDPAGYIRSAWVRCVMLANLNGGDIDPFESPSSEDLNSPLLWLTQAEAMTQAASVLLKNEPAFDTMPTELRGICDTQYCAVALMLVGYSLEVCLKAMIILRGGVDAYTQAEDKYQNHDLEKLAFFIDALGVKDLAILELLTHFVYWAGRYPDPGRRHIAKHEKIFAISEQHQISGQDLFQLAGKVMGHVRTMIDNNDGAPVPA